MDINQVAARLGLLVAMALAGCGGNSGIAPPLPEDEAKALEQQLDNERTGEAGAEVPEDSPGQ